MGGVQSGISGLRGAQEGLNVAGNNISNASTTGFKQSRPEFRDVYAVGTLGVSSTAVGTGTRLSSVTQDFSQGAINPTTRNLDLAINGKGMYILNDGGTTIYSTAGAFFVNKYGNIQNSEGHKLQGYLADSAGAISGTLGSIQVTNSNLSAKATDAVTVKLNLDSRKSRPTTPFTKGFTPGALPSISSYNDYQPVTIYDSLGNAHTLTAYFVKGNYPNTWHVYVGLDDKDVTPTAATPPVGTPPQGYLSADLAQPFTLSFSDKGLFKVKNTAPVYYGSSGVANQIVSNNNPSGLTNTSTLDATNNIQSGYLRVNGVEIAVTVDADDTFSSGAKKASAIAIASKINAKKDQHGITASVNPNTFTLTGPVTGGGTLNTGEFVINGLNVTGTVANTAAMIALINTYSSSTGVTASASGADILLTAADGRNIQLVTDATSAGVTFGNFDLTATAKDQTKRGTYNLYVNDTSNDPIILSGSNPTALGLQTDDAFKRGILYSSSDTIQINNWDPGTGAALQSISLDLSSTTQQAADFANQGLTQTGYAVGRLSRISTSDSGIISAQYTNGQSRQLGQIALADFNNVQGLQPIGKTSWSETFDSGTVIVGKPQQASFGAIRSGALEDSNIDLAQELVNLIIYQRNFQANAQTIRTEDAITQTIINIR
ncbi:MAG: flagellar hook protein FlgE [Gammaproteobacteria bacterium]